MRGVQTRRRPSRWCMALGVASVAMLAWGIMAAFRARESARSTVCRGHLAQFAAGFSDYEEHFGHLPPCFDAASDGRRVHSWRAHIASVVNSVEGSVPYDFEQPWDGPHNSRLAERPFEFFACPSDPETQKDKRLTNYFVVEGSSTAFPGSRCTSLRAIRRRPGTSNTVLVVEASGMSVRWSEPRDLTLDAILQQVDATGHAELTTHHPQGPYALMADGSVRSLHGIAPEVLETMLNVTADSSSQGGLKKREAYISGD
jgi:hypothetical protein